MKKQTFLILAIVFFLATPIGVAGLKAEAATIQLTYATHMPVQHPQTIAAFNWVKEIEKRSQGRVKIQTFPGGSLVKAPQLYDGVLKGISDIAFGVPAFTRGRFPVLACIDLPMGYPSSLVATRVANEFAKTVNPEEIQDVKLMYIHAHGPGVILSKRPVRNLEDLKGMKIRATGTSAKVVKALGGAPVAMPIGQSYEALQKGVTEGILVDREALKGWKLAEVTKSVTLCTRVGYTTTFFIVMNKKKWNALPDDIKKIIDDLNSKWPDVHAKIWDHGGVEGVKYAKSLGNEIIELSDKEHERWVKAVRPVIDDYAAKTPNGKQYVQQIRALMEKYSK
ncbi:TRAP transporter substrate-binding protein [bacterium]|nr:TRAP transporter substrate-binding protein [bacterium]